MNELEKIMAQFVAQCDAVISTVDEINANLKQQKQLLEELVVICRGE